MNLVEGGLVTQILESGRDPNDLKQLELLDRQIADLRAQIATMEDSKDSVRAEMRAEMVREFVASTPPPQTLSIFETFLELPH